MSRAWVSAMSPSPLATPPSLLAASLASHSLAALQPSLAWTMPDHQNGKMKAFLTAHLTEASEVTVVHQTRSKEGFSIVRRKKRSKKLRYGGKYNFKKCTFMFYFCPSFSFPSPHIILYESEESEEEGEEAKCRVGVIAASTSSKLSHRFICRLEVIILIRHRSLDHSDQTAR